MKKSFWKIIAVLIVIVMLSSVSIGHTPDVVDYVNYTDVKSIHVPAGVVWSDNFDDEDISDWQLFVHNLTANPDTLEPGNSTAEGGVLRHIGVEWSYAGHNSSVAFGTWSFDVEKASTPTDGYIIINFLSPAFTLDLEGHMHND